MNKSYKTLIVEDDVDSSILLEGLLKDYAPKIEIVAMCRTYDEAMTLLSTRRFDLTFLDQLLPEGWTGSDIVENAQSENLGIVVLNSSLPVLSFEKIRYFKNVPLLTISKMFDKEIIVDFVARLETFVQSVHTKNNLIFLQHKVDGISYPVSPNTIIYLESNGNYVHYHLEISAATPNPLVVREAISTSITGNNLEEAQFFQTHRQYIVNVNKIKHLENPKGAQASGSLHLTTGQKIPITREKIEDLKLLRRR